MVIMVVVMMVIMVIVMIVIMVILVVVIMVIVMLVIMVILLVVMMMMVPDKHGYGGVEGVETKGCWTDFVSNFDLKITG